MNPSVLIYDCEIEKAIPNPKVPIKDGIQYCDGWSDYKNMGISVIGCYDYRHDQYRIFSKDNFEEFRVLVNSVDGVIGFNNGGFDDLLLKAVLNWSIPENRSYDLLSEVWIAAGLPSRRFAGPKYTGYSLDALSKANSLPGKTGTGELAPVLWQEKKIGTVVDYCLNDVALTKKLVDKVVDKGYLTSPVTGKGLMISTFAKLFNRK